MSVMFPQQEECFMQKTGTYFNRKVSQIEDDSIIRAQKVSISPDGTLIGVAIENGKHIYIFKLEQEDENCSGFDAVYLVASCKRAGFFSLPCGIKSMTHSPCNGFFAVSTIAGEISFFNLRSSFDNQGKNTNEFIKSHPIHPFMKVTQKQLA